MKKFWATLAILFVFAPLGAASADVVAISQEIHLRGVVLPMRFIVLDGRDDVTEITSNTPDYVKPKVYVGSIQHGQQVPLTPQLDQEYKDLARGHDLHSMDLHVTPGAVAELTAPAKHHSRLDFLKTISFLHFFRPL